MTLPLKLHIIPPSGFSVIKQPPGPKNLSTLKTKKIPIPSFWGRDAFKVLHLLDQVFSSILFPGEQNIMVYPVNIPSCYSILVRSFSAEIPYYVSHCISIKPSWHHSSLVCKWQSLTSMQQDVNQKKRVATILLKFENCGTYRVHHLMCAIAYAGTTDLMQIKMPHAADLMRIKIAYIASVFAAFYQCHFLAPSGNQKGPIKKVCLSFHLPTGRQPGRKKKSAFCMNWEIKCNWGSEGYCEPLSGFSGGLGAKTSGTFTIFS